MCVHVQQKIHLYITESSITEKPGEMNTKSSCNRIMSYVLNLLGCSYRVSFRVSSSNLLYYWHGCLLILQLSFFLFKNWFLTKCIVWVCACECKCQQRPEADLQELEFWVVSSCSTCQECNLGPLLLTAKPSL